jgi:hypothetical protein
MLRWNGNDAPSPSKAARTILTVPNQVKIASESSSSLICFTLFQFSQGQLWRHRRTATAWHTISEFPVAIAAAVPAIAHLSADIWGAYGPGVADRE